MVNSAIVTVNGNVLPTTGTTGENVASGSALTIALANSAGVSSWTILCTGVDEITNQTTINNSLVQNNTTWTATFTMPTTSQGAAMQFTSTVNGGVGNAANGGNTFTFGVFVLLDGYRLFFGGESDESNATVGNAADLNKAVRGVATGGGGGGGFTAGGDLSGTSTDQTVIGIQGHAVASTSPSEGQFMVEGSGSTWKPTTLSGDVSASVVTPGDLTVVALQGNALESGTNGSAQDGYVLTWHNASSQFQVLPQTGGFVAGGDLRGTSTSQQVDFIQGVSISGTAGLNKYLGCFTGSAAEWQYPNNLNGVIVSATAPTAGQILTSISGTSASWQTIATGGFTAGGDLSGTSTSQKVIAIQGNPVNATPPTASQVLIENSGATGSVWTTISQDGYLGTGGSSNPATYRGVNVANFVIGAPSVTPSLGSNYGNLASADINYINGKFSGSGATKTVMLSFQFEAMQCGSGNMSTAVITNTISKTANSYCVNFFANVDALLTAGFTVIIKAHQLNASSSVAFTYQNIAIGSSGFSNAQFGAAWAMISALYSTNANVWYSLINEPNSVGDSQWTTAMQAAINAIRANNTVGKILVSPVNYGSCYGFPLSNYSGSSTAEALVASLTGTNLCVELHNYADGVNGFAGESTSITNVSGAADSNILVENLTPCLTWAAANSWTVYVGEFAVDTANGLAASCVNAMYSLINANTATCIGGTWWNYTPVGAPNGPLLFDLQPTTPYTVDAPDMALFTPFLVYSTGSGGTLGALYVQGLQTIPIATTAPTTNQVLTYNGTHWAPAAASGFTAGGDLSGTSSSQEVNSAKSGLLVFTATTGQITAASTATNPGLSQTNVTTNSATAENMSITAQNATGTTSVGGNVVLTAGTGTSTNGSIEFITSNITDTLAPAQGTVSSQAKSVVQYVGYATVTNTTVTILTIPLPGSTGTFMQALITVSAAWRITSATGKGTGGGQNILIYAKNNNGSVSVGSGTPSANVAGPVGDTTVLSEVQFATTVSGNNVLVEVVSSSGQTFDCTAVAQVIFN